MHHSCQSSALVAVTHGTPRALRLKVHMDMHMRAEGALTLLAHAHEVLLEGEHDFHSPA